MDKLVVISSPGTKIDTSNSVAHEDFDEYPNVILLAKGVAVFNERMELLPLISDFLTHYRIDHSDHSIKTYANNLRYLVEYLTTQDDNHIGSNRDDCLLTVHATEIQQYFDYCRKEDNKNGIIKKAITGSTISNRDATYHRFFSKFLSDPPSGYRVSREDNPYDNEHSLANHAKEPLIKPALFSDIEALIRVAHHEREKCLIQFMYDSGIRRGEVSRIYKEAILQLSRESRKSIIIDEYTFQVPSNYVVMEIQGNKGRRREYKPRNTVVSKETINRVQRYHSSLEYKKNKRKWGTNPIPAFLNKNGDPYTPRAVTKLINKLSKRALKFGLISFPISPHKIRHGFGAMLLNSDDFGNSQLDRLLLLQQCLGHKSLDTTQDYTKIPIGIWAKFVDGNGVELKRYQLMKKLKDKTKAKILRL